MTPILVMKYMGWGWDDVERCPAAVWDDVLTLMQKEEEASRQLARPRVA